MQASLPGMSLLRLASAEADALGMRVAVSASAELDGAQADLVFAALDGTQDMAAEEHDGWLLLQPRAAALRDALNLASVAHAAVYLPPPIQLGLAWFARQQRHALRVDAQTCARLDDQIAGWLLALRRLPNSVPRCRHGDPQGELLGRARAAVLASLEDGGGIDSIAERAALTRGQLNRVLRRGCGLSPGRYRSEQRLRRAALLILIDGLRCAEAAAQVGYRSGSQFSAEFARLYGVRPSRLVGLVEALLGRRSEAASGTLLGAEQASA